MAEAQSKPRRKGAKTIAREYFEAISAHDLERAGAMWRPGAIDRFHGIADLVAPDDVRRFFKELFDAFPDWTMEVVDVAASGDRAAVRWRATGTFTGPGRFQGLPPTGARVEVEGCDMLSIEDGVITENHAYTNGTEIARQLGVLPPAGSIAERAMTAGANARTGATRVLRRTLEKRR